MPVRPFSLVLFAVTLGACIATAWLWVRSHDRAGDLIGVGGGAVMSAGGELWLVDAGDLPLVRHTHARAARSGGPPMARPTWVLPHWALLAATCVPLTLHVAAAWRGRLRARRRLQRFECPRCGYDVRAANKGRCPECGEDARHVRPPNDDLIRFAFGTPVRRDTPGAKPTGREP